MSAATGIHKKSASANSPPATAETSTIERLDQSETSSRPRFVIRKPARHPTNTPISAWRRLVSSNFERLRRTRGGPGFIGRCASFVVSITQPTSDAPC